jgi:hypothetical protein
MLWRALLACLAVLVFAGLYVKRLRRWFLISGCFGVLVALVLMVLPHVNPHVLLVLWPASIAGLADPSTVWDKIMVASFEFGGNFVLYGAVGTLVGLGFRGKPSQSNSTTR